LTGEEQTRLFEAAASNHEWEHVYLAAVVAANMFGAFRNVTAHAPRITWVITEQDALDLLTIASLLHRRIDAAIATPRPSAP
jgi:hypothetical protein